MQAAPLSSGVYLIVNLQTSTVLDLTAGNPQNGTLVIGEVFNTGNNQAWTLTCDETTGYYTLRNLQSKTYASTIQSNPKYKNEYLTVQSNTQADKWLLKTGTQDGAFYICSADSNVLMDLYCGESANGTPVILMSQNPTPSQSINQQWQFAMIG